MKILPKMRSSGTLGTAAESPTSLFCGALESEQAQLHLSWSHPSADMPLFARPLFISRSITRSMYAFPARGCCHPPIRSEERGCYPRGSPTSWSGPSRPNGARGGSPREWSSGFERNLAPQAPLFESALGLRAPDPQDKASGTKSRTWRRDSSKSEPESARSKLGLRRTRTYVLPCSRFWSRVLSFSFTATRDAVARHTRRTPRTGAPAKHRRARPPDLGKTQAPFSLSRMNLPS